MKDTASLIIGIIKALFSPVTVAGNVVILITIKYEGTLPLDFLPTIFWPNYRLQKKWYRFDHPTNSKAMYSTGKLLTTNDTKMEYIALTIFHTCSSLFDNDHSHVHKKMVAHCLSIYPPL